MSTFRDFITSPKVSIILRKIVEVNFRKQKEIISKFFSVSVDEKIIDIGCGTGEFSEFFPKESYIGIDLDKKYITYAQEKYKKDFKQADALHLPFVDHFFDRAIIVGMLHHLDDTQAIGALKEAKRVLKKGGRLLVMEDTKTDFLPTRLLQEIDQGKFIRTSDTWKIFFSDNFTIRKIFSFQNGLCFYTAAILEKSYE